VAVKAPGPNAIIKHLSNGVLVDHKETGSIVNAVLGVVQGSFNLQNCSSVDIAPFTWQHSLDTSGLIPE